jgi:hypothetical protein
MAPAPALHGSLAILHSKLKHIAKGDLRHEDRRPNHQHTDVSLSQAEEDKDDACSTQNAETQFDVADTNLPWVLSIDVIGLGRPKQND